MDKHQQQLFDRYQILEKEYQDLFQNYRATSHQRRNEITCEQKLLLKMLEETA